MIKSMTGYGKATGELPGRKITVELRSLNSKQLDLSLRVPSVYRNKESELRTLISKQAERGKIDFSVFMEFTGEANAISINKPLAKNYFNEIKGLAEELHTDTTNILATIIKMPEVLKAERQEPDENEWKEVFRCAELAMSEFQKFRKEEGNTLKKDFLQRIKTIDGLLDKTRTLDAQRIPSIRERIKKNVDELKAQVDQNRFEQELIYYIEKLDITEEKLRLQTHLDYFLNTMEEESAGRKLGFITQEIGREINTIGSKANDAGIQKLVVQMKDELEKIKEQLLNVL